MVGVDDQVARRQRRDLGKEGVGVLAALAAADQAVAEHILLGQHRDVRRREAVVQRQHQQRRLGLRSKRFLPGVSELLRLDSFVFDEPG